jgi:hypothetical protein
VHNAKPIIADSFEYRYFTENFSYVLTVWLTFAKIANVPTLVLESA